MKFIGVDGCKKGWFFVGLDDNGGWDMGVVPRISESVFPAPCRLAINCDTYEDCILSLF